MRKILRNLVNPVYFHSFKGVVKNDLKRPL